MSEQGRYKDKFEHESARPNRQLWDDIEKNLQKDRRRRFAFWWIPLGLLLATGAGFLAYNQLKKDLEYGREISHAQNYEKGNSRAQQNPNLGVENELGERGLISPSRENSNIEREDFSNLPENKKAGIGKIKDRISNRKEEISSKKWSKKPNQIADIQIGMLKENSHLTSGLEDEKTRGGVRGKFYRKWQGWKKNPLKLSKNENLPFQNEVKEGKNQNSFSLDKNVGDKPLVETPINNPLDSTSKELAKMQEMPDSGNLSKRTEKITKPDSASKKPQKLLWRFHLLGGAYYANKIQKLNQNGGEARQANLTKNEIYAERFSFNLQQMASRKIGKSTWLSGVFGFDYLADKTLLSHRQAANENTWSEWKNDGTETIHPGFQELKREAVSQVLALDFQLGFYSENLLGPAGIRLGAGYVLPAFFQFQETVSGKSTTQSNWFKGNSFAQLNAGLPLYFGLNQKRLVFEPQIIYPLQTVFDTGFGSQNRPLRWGFQVWLEF